MKQDKKNLWKILESHIETRQYTVFEPSFRNNSSTRDRSNMKQIPSESADRELSNNTKYVSNPKARKATTKPSITDDEPSEYDFKPSKHRNHDISAGRYQIHTDQLASGSTPSGLHGTSGLTHTSLVIGGRHRNL